MTIVISLIRLIRLIRLIMLLRRLRVPQVDVQTLDLFDQQENCFSGRAKLLIADVNKTRAPGAELFDLAFVQTIAQRSVHQGLGQSTTAWAKPVPHRTCQRLPGNVGLSFSLVSKIRSQDGVAFRRFLTSIGREGLRPEAGRGQAFWAQP